MSGQEDFDQWSASFPTKVVLHGCPFCEDGCHTIIWDPDDLTLRPWCRCSRRYFDPMLTAEEHVGERYKVQP